MLPITVRPYRADDLASLAALFQASVRSIGIRHYTESQVRAWAPDVIDLEQFAQRCLTNSTWIAEVERNIAGFSDLESDGHIDMLYVHPNFQRRGVARALLADIENLARSQGIA